VICLRSAAVGSTQFLTKMGTEAYFFGGVGVEREAALVVPNVKLGTEAGPSFPTLSLHDFLRDCFFTL
jgi:hypothetical protein